MCQVGMYKCMRVGGGEGGSWTLRCPDILMEADMCSYIVLLCPTC